jgi:hypothetical protein
MSNPTSAPFVFKIPAHQRHRQNHHTTISGGNGNGPYDRSGGAGSGAAGVSNSGRITKLINKGQVIGGRGGTGRNGGDGYANSSTIATVTNNGVIKGANGGNGGNSAVSSVLGGAGGAGIENSFTIAILTNSGKIAGGNGGSGYYGGKGGSGIENSGTIGALTNSGNINGGVGGSGLYGGKGGTGIENPGTIGTLTNSGTISGRLGGSGSIGSGAPGGAIYSTGTIDSIMNSGKFIGTVEIDQAASVIIYGGTGTTFGSFIPGVIATESIIIGGSNLTFASGNTEIDEDISVDGGAGTVVDPTGFYGKISEFGLNDTVKLDGFWAFSALSHTSGMTTLTLAEGATRHAFEFVGDYTRREVHIAPGKITTIKFA